MIGETPKEDPLINPWVPMTNPKDLKHLLKLGEEASELISAIFRCTMQGIDEREPITGKVNRAWLEEEIADTLANLQLNIEHFGLNKSVIQLRMDRKIEGYRKWHGML